MFCALLYGLLGIKGHVTQLHQRPETENMAKGFHIEGTISYYRPYSYYFTSSYYRPGLLFLMNIHANVGVYCLS